MYVYVYVVYLGEMYMYICARYITYGKPAWAVVNWCAVYILHLYYYDAQNAQMDEVNVHVAVKFVLSLVISF